MIILIREKFRDVEIAKRLMSEPSRNSASIRLGQKESTELYGNQDGKQDGGILLRRYSRR